MDQKSASSKPETGSANPLAFLKNSSARLLSLLSPNFKKMVASSLPGAGLESTKPMANTRLSRQSTAGSTVSGSL